MSVNIWIWGIMSFPLAVLLSVHKTYLYILSLFVWDRSLAALWNSLHHAATFEKWEAVGLALDHRYRIDTWRKVDKSSAYAWELIGDRLSAFALALQAGHTQALVHLLQSGLVRNLGNITVPELYNASFAGTKYLIENYILQVCEIIRDLVALPVPGAETETAATSVLSPELANAVAEGRCQLPTLPEKRQLFNSLRQSFGRTTLVFQGGSIFGVCHIGVARALFLRGLLPRIITGTGTGALIAALIGTHTDEELPDVLDGVGIDLSAFAARQKQRQADEKASGSSYISTLRTRFETLYRRVLRFWHEGYFLDVTVLERCLRDNGGDLTFEEAFHRTGRVLNITVVTGTSAGDVPSVLNYVTAPNVLIWTAAVASNASSVVSDAATTAWYGRRQTAILSKEIDADGSEVVRPWPLADAAQFRHWTYGSYGTRHSPLQRVAQLFNVNHFVVSQARPYLVPFLEPSLHSPTMRGFAMGTLAKANAFVMHQAGHLVRHRLDQMLGLGWLPLALRRLLLDEQIPGGPNLLLVPTVPIKDYVRLLDSPSQQTLQYWITKGERAVWPAVAALKIRCSVELALEQACQDLSGTSSTLSAGLPSEPLPLVSLSQPSVTPGMSSGIPLTPTPPGLGRAGAKHSQGKSPATANTSRRKSTVPWAA
ncbi:patatin-like phospholipase [Ophiostoma piceae UAMH 11346]|uniref:Patatin-like phospholipase n=1 Tax=Ophiostoma piceae (strain UAMH 11346) TaxID=1262450 RepID=S3D0P0_OPHP1|nr:patatin-like phospholipase [Ophiostoma piceae UAMH 11346]